jgi:hypothetical protein
MVMKKILVVLIVLVILIVLVELIVLVVLVVLVVLAVLVILFILVVLVGRGSEVQFEPADPPDMYDSGHVPCWPEPDVNGVSQACLARRVPVR